MNSERVRLDKWLWAARFFRTRELARTAVDGGQVHYQGQRAKPGRNVQVGAEIEILRGRDRFVVIVEVLDDRRRGAAEAARLYSETRAGRAAREQAAEQRRIAARSQVPPARRPDRRARGRIIRFQRSDGSS